MRRSAHREQGLANLAICVIDTSLSWRGYQQQIGCQIPPSFGQPLQTLANSGQRISPDWIERMNFSLIIMIIACFAVGIILMRGLWNMMQGGSANTSQRLMRMRVAAQAVAILVIVVVVYLSR